MTEKMSCCFPSLNLGMKTKRLNPAPGSHTANHLLGRLPTPSSKGGRLQEKCLFGGPKSNIALTSLLTRVGLPKSPLFLMAQTRRVQLISQALLFTLGLHVSSCWWENAHLQLSPLGAASCLNRWLLPYHLSRGLVNFLFSIFLLTVRSGKSL